MQTLWMGKKKKVDDETASPEHHLREWREYRRLTQDQLGEMAGTTGSVIHLIETGQRGLSDKWLRRLAPHLGCLPGWIVDHDPDDLDTNMLEIWGQIPKDKREQALAVLQTFRKKRA